MLVGPAGCGKSQAATWAAFQLSMRGFGARCAMCMSASEAPLYGGEAEEYRWRCATAGVLVLDDLGEGEQRNEKRSAWRAWVDDVLTQRHAQGRKTIITTNRSPAELRAWLGARIVDRLNEGVISSTNEASLRGTT
jgi:DNA replication protein DnaC